MCGLGELLIGAAIAQRREAGLSLSAYGAEGYTRAAPFTCHAKDPAQRDNWRATMERKGFTVEPLA
jgi:hypothetical protein